MYYKTVLVILLFEKLTANQCFNIDLNHSIIFEDPGKENGHKKSYFGYSVVLYADNKEDEKKNPEKWIKIGAPRAISPSSNEQSGLIYHCPFLKQCEIEALNYSKPIFGGKGDSLNNAWLGGAMDIDYKSKILGISAASWTYFDNHKPIIRGGILIKNLKTNSTQTTSPFQKPEVVDKLPYYARARAGFSLHFSRNGPELLAGAPGVSNYLGTVLKIKNYQLDQKQWDYQIAEPQGNYDQYAGYSVTSGYFYDPNKISYAFGLPRGPLSERNIPMPNIIYGSVVIFSFLPHRIKHRDNQFETRNSNIFYGTQFGENFGFALTAGDLNGDRLDDLIVGAPFRKNDPDGYNYGSVYVFYGKKGQIPSEAAQRIDGRVTNGQFGYAMMYLGDIKKVDVAEIAIAAPFEDPSGTLYIYAYDKDSVGLTMLQRIQGHDVYENLRGFGMSISRPKDIDNNHFDDIVVGAPVSGHAVLLRSKPIVTIYRQIEVPTSITRIAKELVFKYCFRYTDYPGNSFNITRLLIVDENWKRFIFKNGEYVEKRLITMYRKKEFCETLRLEKIKKSKNFLDPIIINLSYKTTETPESQVKNVILIAKNNISTNDTFCKECAVLSRKSLKTLEKQIMWDHTCGDKKTVCTAELSVKGEFKHLSKPDTFILGSSNVLYLVVKLTNIGDPDFGTQLNVTLPYGINFRKRPINCEYTDETSTICEFNDDLEGEVISEFELNMKNINDIFHSDKEELTFYLNTTTSIRNIGESNRNLTLKLSKEAYFLITGETKEVSYSLNEDKSAVIQNIFKIEKFGPSSIQEIEVEISVPYKMKNSISRFTKTLNSGNNNMNAPLITCKNPEPDHRRDQKISNMTNIAISNHSLNLDCSNESVECEMVQCFIGPFTRFQKHVELLVKAEIKFDDYKNLVQKYESIFITTQASVIFNLSSKNSSHIAIVANLITLTKNYQISFWIILGSAAAGLLILICFSVALAKAGFFERKDHEKLKQLKEEALEEERLIEEMIELELAKDELNEQSQFVYNEQDVSCL